MTTASATSTERRWDDLLLPCYIPEGWLGVLQDIPGYDSVAAAVGCRFDLKAAKNAVNFFSDHIRHVEGAVAGQPFHLELWQQAIIVNLFGWKRLDSMGRLVRRYREAFVYVPRKNGKTPLTAGIALLVFFADPEPGQQDYIAAGDREQAGMLFRQAKGMVEQSPILSKRCRVYGGNAAGGQSRSIVKSDNSFLRVISADADTKHGGNLHFGVIDELHVQPNRDLVDVIQTSMASANRRQPLLIEITTADYNRPSICNEKHEYACKVRDGIIDDSTFLPVIYEALPEEDWKSEEVWRKANPNLGVSVSIDYLRAECKKAAENPAYENVFKRLHLNMKTEQDVRAVPMDRWDAITTLVDLADLEGEECYAGLDLSTTTDLSALVLVFPREEGYAVLPYFWVPREGARRRQTRDRVPYETWIRQGHVTATAGDVIDYDQVRHAINDLGGRYKIREIAADRWNATQLITQLQGDGFNVVAFGQGFASMTAPTKEFLALVTSGRLFHGNNPVLRWMASNLATESDAAGNLKPSKKKSTERIDGCVATIMALGRALLRPERGSVYESRGIELL